MRTPIKCYRGLAVLATGLCLALVPSVFASGLNLGSAANYTVVGVGGTASVQSSFEIYQSNTVITGNVAEGPHSTLTHGIDATVNGRWDYDLTDANPAAAGFTGTVTGGFHQIDLSGVSADARAASASAAAFAPTQTFSSLSEGQDIVGTSGVNVIRITGDSTIKTFLDLTGTSSSVFIFQFTSSTTAGHDVLSLSGMTMDLLGEVQPDNIYWDFNGAGGDLSITAMKAGQTVYGNFLAPDRNVLADQATIDGRLIGGGDGSLLSIHSSSTITAVPEAGTTLLVVLGTALLGVARFVRRRLA